MKLAVRRTSAAIAAFATVSVSSLFLGAAPASAVPVVDACGQGGTLISGNICEKVFTSGTSTFTPTAQMTKLEVLLVGGGGDGADNSSSNGYAAGGGGGQVSIVDFGSEAPDPLTLVVGAAGAASSATNGTIVRTASPGGPGQPANGGTSGSGYGSGTGNAFSAGGGAGASPSNSSGNGGDGVVVSTIAPSGSLFSTDSNCYGGGGAIGIVGTAGAASCGGGHPVGVSAPQTLVAPTANSGGGGGSLSVAAPLNVRQGAAGLVVVRWTAQTVTLAFNGNGAIVAPQTLALGTAPTRPADPIRSGQLFGGWYTSAAFTTLADFTTPLTAATTFYARWTPAMISLSFEGNGATVAAQPVAQGTPPTKPADPTRAGYVFTGWYSDAALTTLADFSAPLTASTTFYASWAAVPTVTLSFRGEGSAVVAQTVPAGTVPAKPADPTRAGYVFTGWYSDEALTTLADFSAPLTAATTFYASWSPALAATGGVLNQAALPIGAAALVLGAGLFVAGYRRKRSVS
jgi:uncharacterized repeat protein (TIGR02543 family)